ncbi:hypothetical protein [Flavobacterium sp. 7A]|uniref:hypothetical protein n=1 Tax=Flavobacterium sp. 7A TaxID=2940571 RepID=UPI002227A9C4|nr:hypothetical protein [Flavobacterium sp. 7A]MCW2119300.1 hypothetical protein [Flavobacterium sp. 7A]
MRKQILLATALFTITTTTQAQDLPQRIIPSIIVNRFNIPESTHLQCKMDNTLNNIEIENGSITVN